MFHIPRYSRHQAHHELSFFEGSAWSQHNRASSIRASCTQPSQISFIRFDCLLTLLMNQRRFPEVSNCLNTVPESLLRLVTWALCNFQFAIKRDVLEDGSLQCVPHAQTIAFDCKPFERQCSSNIGNVKYLGVWSVSLRTDPKNSPQTFMVKSLKPLL